jgi:hypothetical protein
MMKVMLPAAGGCCNCIHKAILQQSYYLQGTAAASAAQPCSSHHDCRNIMTRTLNNTIAWHVLPAACRCGADVVVTDVKASAESKDLIGRLQDVGSRAMFLECDVRDRTAVDDVMKEVER